MVEAGSPQARLKRLTMRSHRRGIREMDLILGPFATAELAGFDAGSLDLYERLLEENDHDLYAWISGRPAAAGTGPAPFHPLLDRIAAFARSGRAGAPAAG
jgi:antitoxin CptB